MTGARIARAPLAATGFSLIWAFLLLFILYPLTRIFYDAFTDDAGVFTLVNFAQFFSDHFYLRSLWRSLSREVKVIEQVGQQLDLAPSIAVRTGPETEGLICPRSPGCHVRLGRLIEACKIGGRTPRRSPRG